MTPPHNHRAIFAIGSTVALLAIAGCGGSSSGSYGGTATSAKPQGTSAASVKLADSGLGKILVGGHGRSLYLFEADKGPSSACSGACAQAWPPLTTAAAPQAGAGVAAAR